MKQRHTVQLHTTWP